MKLFTQNLLALPINANGSVYGIQKLTLGSIWVVVHCEVVVHFLQEEDDDDDGMVAHANVVHDEVFDKVNVCSHEPKVQPTMCARGIEQKVLRLLGQMVRFLVQMDQLGIVIDVVFSNYPNYSHLLRFSA